VLSSNACYSSPDNVDRQFACGFLDTKLHVGLQTVTVDVAVMQGCGAFNEWQWQGDKMRTASDDDA
jgi:hypothetical protein